MERLRNRAAILTLLLLAGITIGVSAGAQVVDRTTMTNKVMCGYQGWHMCPGDGNNPAVGWNHWSESGSYIGPDYYHCEIWPDVTEYDASDLFFVPNTTLVQGGTPYLFSDFRQGAVNTQFRWMQENLIDGVYHQRFVGGYVGDPDDPWQHKLDVVLQNVMNASNTYGRAWCLEYDISGCQTAELYDKLTGDWTYLNSAFDIKNHSRYLQHNGKPVIVIWGFGFGDRPGTPAVAQSILDWFKADGCFVVAGVPIGWRTDGTWINTYHNFDGITPWTVGCYRTTTDINNFKTNYVVPDLADCNSHGILYMTTAWPRFGWDNMNHYPCGQSDFSPRGGQHLWDQFYNWKSAGVTTQFIAMFDEYDESTAIMKLTDNIPTYGCWWTTEGYGNDWYLRLANQGSKMQKGQIALSQTIPIVSGNSPDNASVVGDTIPATMNLGQQYNVSVTMQNNGETCWSDEFFKLGALNDSDPFYPSNRVQMGAGQTVMPGQQKVFSFTMTAPTTNGDYTTDWKMVHERIRWFGATDKKVVRVGTGPDTLNNSTFNSSADGWTITTWRAGTGGYGVMAWNSSAGRTGGGMRCNGASSTDNTDRCAREGGEISKTISTVGHTSIRISYDLRVNTLGQNRTGAGTGSCTVDHSLIDEQITAFYSTNGGANWTEAEWIKRVDLKAGYTSYGTRTIDLSDVAAANNNPNFKLRFRWQLNTTSDAADLDNIVVMGNATDVTPPGPVTGFAATPGDTQNSLSWTNPTDPDFAGTMVRYKTTGFPTGPADGTQVYTGTGTSCVHSNLVNGVAYYYSAFTCDNVPNYSAAANASATPNGTSCYVDHFAYSNGALNGNGGWSGTATSAQIELTGGTVRLLGGSGYYDAGRTVSCGVDASGFINVTCKINGETGTDTMWNLWIDDASGNNLARWYGSGTTARGRIGGTGLVTGVQTLSGGWDNLWVKISPTANTSEFFFNGVSIGVLDHTGAGDTVGRLEFERMDAPTTVGNSLFFDDLRIGLVDDTTPPGPVTNFIATPGDAQISLSWTNPTSDYAGTLVRFKTTGFPTGVTDGTQVYNGTGTGTLHGGLTNGVTYYYSAWAYDGTPNYSTVANASATPVPGDCFFDQFSYSNGNLNGNGGWSGSATSEITVSGQTVRMDGGAGMRDAIKTVTCGDPGTGYILVHMKVKAGTGASTMWSLYIDDAAGLNLARWYGAGTTARGRIGGGASVTATQTLTGPGTWDNLKVKITPSANTSEFFFNDVSIGVLDHGQTGAGDVIGRLRFERADNSGAAGHYLFFDDLRVGP